MRVLITGGRGQLATELAELCRRHGDEVAAPSSSELDITDRSLVRAVVAATAPDVVVNAAAWTAVDDCERDPDRARAVNTLGVRWLAEAVAATGSHLVQVSTDYVFSGTKDGPHDEWDPTDPVSVYGRTKLDGEREAAAGCPGATIVRTAWLSGIHGSNMVRTVLGLRDRDVLAFVDDQIGSPTLTADVAPVVRALARERVPGVFHAANRGAVSWFTFVRDILAAAGADPDIVRAIRTDELDPPRPAPRPANSALRNRALTLAGFDDLPDYRESLVPVVETLLAREADRAGGTP